MNGHKKIIYIRVHICRLQNKYEQFHDHWLHASFYFDTCAVDAIVALRERTRGEPVNHLCPETK